MIAVGVPVYRRETKWKYKTIILFNEISKKSCFPKYQSIYNEPGSSLRGLWEQFYSMFLFLDKIDWYVLFENRVFHRWSLYRRICNLPGITMTFNVFNLLHIPNKIFSSDLYVIYMQGVSWKPKQWLSTLLHSIVCTYCRYANAH